MIRLNTDNYKKILPMIKNIKHNKVLISSVIEGSSKGAIFADNADSPKNIFIDFDFCFLISDEENTSFFDEVFEYIFDTIIPRSTDKEIMLFIPTDNCDYIKDKLKDKGAIEIKRKMFKLSRDKFKEAEKSILKELPLYNVTKIDTTFAQKHDVFREIIDTDKKFGFCIMDKESILSYCLSVAVGNSQAEIDIYTDEAHRNKGLALISAAAFINHCLENDIEPIWSCWENREASKNLANKLGFEEDEDITAVLFSEYI